MPYHVNDYIRSPSAEFNQGEIANGLKIAQSGFCAAACMQWVIECHKDSGVRPDEILKVMNRYGRAYWKQIAQNQVGGIGRFDESEGSVMDSSIAAMDYSIGNQKSMTLMSKGKHGLLPSSAAFTSEHELTTQMRDGVMFSTSDTKSCLISFRFSKGDHMLAAVYRPNNGTWFLFDPNFGVMVFELDDLFKAAESIFATYKPWRGAVATVL